ncbi:MAG: T9SS type A sorting domain-containing protein, partial [Bacteroidota bacterium]|nr:T9SS type A sorting domain-containing protein [Bacteroidota bacterium]
AKSTAKTQSDLDFALYTLNLAARKFNAAQHIIIYDDLTNATSLPDGELYYIKSGDKYLSCADAEKGASTLEDQVPGGLLNYQVWRIKKSNSNPPRYTISSVLKNSTDTIQGYFLNDNAFAWKGANGTFTDWVIFGNGSNVTLWNYATRCVEVKLNKDGITDTMTRDLSERNYIYQLIPYTGIEGQVADITPLSTAIANASSLLVGAAGHEYYNSQKSELISAIDVAKAVVSAGNANQAVIDKYLSILARTSSNFKTALDFINSGNSIPSTILFKSTTIGLMSSGMKIEAAGNLGYTSNGSYALIVLKPEVTGNYTLSYLASTDNANASIVTTITDSIGLMSDYTNLTASIDTFAINKGGWSSWTGDTINISMTGGKTYYLRFNWIGSGSNVKEMKFTVEGVISYILLKNAITEADSLVKKATGIQYLTSKVAELNLQLAASKDLVLTDTASQVTVDAYALELLKTTADLNTMYLNYKKITDKGVHVPASIPFNSETVPLMSSGMQIESAGNLGYTNDGAYALITLIADTTCTYRMTYKACSPNNGACIVSTITDSVGRALDFKNIADKNHLFNVTIKDWSTWFNDTIDVNLKENGMYFLRFNFQVSGSNLKDLKFEAVRKVEDAVDKNSISDICFMSAEKALRITGLVKGSRISVYSIDGALVSSQKAENQIVTIPMKKGIYLVSVNTVNKQQVGKVMVK